MSTGSAILDSLRNHREHPIMLARMAERPAAVAHPAAASTKPTTPPVVERAARKSWTRADFDRVDAELLKVAPGKYALSRRDPSSAGNTITFLVVFASQRGGRTRHMIRQLIGAPGAFREQTLPLEHQYFAALHIAEDPREALARYGRETQTCGKCDSPLTNDKSRAAGIGPKCATRI